MKSFSIFNGARINFTNKIYFHGACETSSYCMQEVWFINTVKMLYPSHRISDHEVIVYLLQTSCKISWHTFGYTPEWLCALIPFLYYLQYMHLTCRSYQDNHNIDVLVLYNVPYGFYIEAVPVTFYMSY